MLKLGRFRLKLPHHKQHVLNLSYYLVQYTKQQTAILFQTFTAKLKD